MCRLLSIKRHHRQKMNCIRVEKSKSTPTLFRSSSVTQPNCADDAQRASVVIRHFVKHNLYTLSHRECGQLHPRMHENFEKFKMISTPTGSWIRSRLRRDRIQLPVGVEITRIFQNFHAYVGEAVRTLDGTEYKLKHSSKISEN